MENLNMNIDYIFPTPIAIIKVPNTFFKIGKYLDSVPHKEDHISSAYYGTRSANSYILNSPELKEFKDYVILNINHFGQKILNITHFPYTITQSWVSYKHPNEFHRQHSHPNSLISGVFYWELKDGSLPKINFHKNEVSTSFTIFPNYYKGNIPNPMMGDTVEISIEPGNLILFPSYLSHSVSMNETNEIRKSLAFNSIPKSLLGDEGNLTEFKYNI